MKHHDLWKQVFSDTDKYLDFYFQKKAPISLVYSQYEKEELTSMAFSTPYAVSFFGDIETFHYIVGVATSPDYRRQGRMKELLLENMTERYEEGEIMSYLSPAKEEYYSPFGFSGLYWRQSSVVSEFGKSDLVVVNFSRLSEEKRKEVVTFVNQKLNSSLSNLFVRRSIEYYRLLRREMQALDGGVLVFCNADGEVIGTLTYGTEGGVCEVYEMICHKVYSRQVVNVFWNYLREKKASLKEKQVTFFDTQYLPEEFERKEEKKPYLMGRIIHLGNFLQAVPSDIICEAFGKQKGSSFCLDVTDTILPMNSGSYLIAAGNAVKIPRRLETIQVSVTELEEKIFPYLNTYINDIT